MMECKDESVGKPVGYLECADEVDVVRTIKTMLDACRPTSFFMNGKDFLKAQGLKFFGRRIPRKKKKRIKNSVVFYKF